MVSAGDQYVQDYKRASEQLKTFRANVQECSEALKKGQSTAKYEYLMRSGLTQLKQEM